MNDLLSNKFYDGLCFLLVYLPIHITLENYNVFLDAPIFTHT